MVRFLLNRLMWMAITLWVVYTVSFMLMRAVPGGPFDQERVLPPHVKAAVEARHNLDQPLIVQYGLSLGAVLTGDLGPCFKMGDFTVNEIVAQGFPISASLGVLAMTFALTLGIATGVVSAVKRQTTIDFTLRSIATVGIAIPNFVIASIAVICLSFVVPLLPPAGWGSFRHLILPATCLGAPYAAYVARLVRTGMLDVLNQDYIRTAYAKGLLPQQVILKHALKGAMLPVASFLAPAIAASGRCSYSSRSPVAFAVKLSVRSSVIFWVVGAPRRLVDWLWQTNQFNLTRGSKKLYEISTIKFMV